MNCKKCKKRFIIIDFRITVILYYTISIKSLLLCTIHFIDFVFFFLRGGGGGGGGGLGLDPFLSTVLICHFPWFFKFIFV